MDGMTKITAHSNYLEEIINLIIIKKNQGRAEFVRNPIDKFCS